MKWVSAMSSAVFLIEPGAYICVYIFKLGPAGDAAGYSGTPVDAGYSGTKLCCG